MGFVNYHKIPRSLEYLIVLVELATYLLRAA